MISQANSWDIWWLMVRTPFEFKLHWWISLSCCLLNTLAQSEYANCYFSSSICQNHPGWPSKTINKRNKKFSIWHFFVICLNQNKKFQRQVKVFLYPTSSAFAALFDCDLNQHIQASITVPHWSYTVISPAGGSFLNTDWSGKETIIYAHTEKESSSVIFSVHSTASLHFQKYGHSRNLSPKTFSKHWFNCLVHVLATSSGFSSTWQNFSHIYLFSPCGNLPKNWAETLANQNKNSEIFDEDKNVLRLSSSCCMGVPRDTFFHFSQPFLSYSSEAKTCTLLLLTSLM